MIGAARIANPGYHPARAERAPVERAWVYRPDRAWTYSHHAHLCHFAGRFHVLWSNGRCDEDAPGQRVLIASSDDFLHWGEPQELAPSERGEHSELVLTAGGFHHHGGMLVAYVAREEYLPEAIPGGRRTLDGQGRVGKALRAYVSRDGRRWEPPRDCGLAVVPNHGPQALASGRLLISGFIAFPWSDDPQGLGGWHLAGIPGCGPGHEDGPCSATGYRIKAALGVPSPLCESAFIQRDDGTIVMLMRSGGERLWACASSDDGETWSVPAETGFSDNAAKFHLGRLPDGRFYYLGNPDPAPRWERGRLVLSLSNDGERFDRHWLVADQPCEQRAVGMHKIGDYGYPHSLVHDGALHIALSRHKEAIEVLRVPLSSLT